MNTNPVSRYQQAVILWDLKRHGDIDRLDTGGALIELHKRVNSSDLLSIDYDTFKVRLAALRAAGLITSESRGRVSLSVRLFDVGDYPDPEITGPPVVTEPTDDNDSAPTKPPTARSRQPKLGKLLGEIDKLTVAERLMLASQIIDEAAGEVDDREQRIRAILG